MSTVTEYFQVVRRTQREGGRCWVYRFASSPTSGGVVFSL